MKIQFLKMKLWKVFKYFKVRSRNYLKLVGHEYVICVGETVDQTGIFVISRYIVVDCRMMSLRRGKTKFLSSVSITDKVGHYPLLLKYHLIQEARVELTNLIDSIRKYNFFLIQIRRKLKNLLLTPHSLKTGITQKLWWIKEDFFSDAYTYIL